HVDADGRIDRRGRVELADAADERHRSGAVARQLAGGLELQARGDPLEVLRLLDLAIFQRLGAEGRDRHRGFLQRLLAPARGHENGVAPALVVLGGRAGGRILRRSGSAHDTPQRACHDSRSRQKPATVLITRTTHGNSPHCLSPTARSHAESGYWRYLLSTITVYGNNGVACVIPAQQACKVNEQREGTR